MKGYKGYNVSEGYMGYIPSLHKYILFASESDYKDAYEEDIK